MKGGAARYLEVARRFVLFLLFILAAHIFLARGPAPLSARILSGLVQGLRVFDLLAAASLFLAVTDPVDLSDSFIDLLRRPGGGGRRIEEASLMLMIVFSFLPLVAEEAGRLRTAVGTRCGFGGGLVRRARSSVALLAALVVGIMRRAEELEISLAARGYSSGSPRGGRGARPGAWDAALLAVSIILFAAGLYAQL